MSDGIAAWEQLKKPGGPRLARLDWVMPGMDGVEVCRKVREAAFHDPHFIIIVTARGDKQDVAAGLRAGANDYISKPFDITDQEVWERLEDYISQRSDAKFSHGVCPDCLEKQLVAFGVKGSMD